MFKYHLPSKGTCKCNGQGQGPFTPAHACCQRPSGTQMRSLAYRIPKLHTWLGVTFFLHVSPVKCSGGERRQDGGGGSFNETTQPKTSWIFVPNLLIFRQRSGSVDSIEWSGWSARPLGLRVGIPRAGHWKECWSLFAVELFNLIAKRKALNGSKSRWAHPDD